MNAQPRLFPLRAHGATEPPPPGWSAPVSRYRLELVREPDPPPYLVDVSASRPGSLVRWLWEHLLEREAREVFGAVYLDGRHHLIGYHVAYTGSLARCTVDPRGVLVPALLANAAGLVLFHNHPSGDVSPSAEDLAFTRRIHRAGEIVGVHLVDHLVIGSGMSWCSLRERGGW